MTEPQIPLGRVSQYPNKYDSSLLFPIARCESRDAFITGKLPFFGVDVWNAWELTWLRRDDMPVIATLEIRVPATTPQIIESKSLKLYLNSFAMSQFDNSDAVTRTIATDLSSCTQGDVEVYLQQSGDFAANSFSSAPGTCIDSTTVAASGWIIDPTILSADNSDIVDEQLHSHLLRSLCPVTAQPDIGSLFVHYKGPRIDRETLLQYIVSFRQHNDFHEACIERMYVDILQQCDPQQLSVFARYQRRGGIDINPYRSNFEDQPRNQRLWRQ